MHDTIHHFLPSRGTMVEKSTSTEERTLTQELVAKETENRQIEKLLKQYDIRDVQTLLDEKVLAPELFKKIIDAWLERLSVIGEYVQVIQDADIDLFSDHIELQPALPYATIGFTSDTALPDSIATEDQDNILASVLAPVVELPQERPNTRNRLFTWLATGRSNRRLDEFLIHMIRYVHNKQASDFGEIFHISEAFLHGLCGDVAMLSTAKIVEKITASQKKYNHELIARTVDFCAKLRVAQYPYDEIRTMCKPWWFDKAENACQKFIDEAHKKLTAETGHLAQTPRETLDGAIKILAQNEVLKARHGLFKTFFNLVPPENINELRIAMVRNHILRPVMYVDGQEQAIPLENRQFVVCPASTEMPYDPQGERVGILFGFFDNKKDGESTVDQKQQEFRLVRWETDGQTSKIVSDPFGEDEAYYLDILSLQAEQIAFADKARLAADYAGIDVYRNALVRKVLRALVLPEDWYKIITLRLPYFEQKIAHVAEELSRIQAPARQRHWSETSLQRLQGLKKDIDDVRTYFDYAGKRPEDFNQDLAKKMYSLGFTLTTYLERS